MKTQIQISKSNGSISIVAPYSETNNAKFRNRGGKYDRSSGWVFADAPASRELISELWGDESPLCVVRIPLGDAKSCGNQEMLGGYVLASRRGRDYRVELADGVTLMEGSFCGSGGSVKNPCVTWDGDVVLHVVVRRSFAERNNLTIVESEDQPVADSNPLADYSDDQLLAEIKRRGLAAA